MNRIKLLSTFLVGLLTAISSVAPSWAAFEIPVGEVNLTTLPLQEPVLGNAYLVKWRGAATTTDLTTKVTNMTFEYFTSGKHVTQGYPTSATVADGTANDQGDLWSDNAIRLEVGKKGNNVNRSIVIYTDNGPKLDPAGSTIIGPDPKCSPATSAENDVLSAVSTRGGFVGAYNGSGFSCSAPEHASVLPILWKAVSINDLDKARAAATTAARLPAKSPLFMPFEIENVDAGAATCPVQAADTPYTATNRARQQAGFCDFSTHYIKDLNDYNWHTRVGTDAEKLGVFRYESVIGYLGLNTSDAGLGGGGAPAAAYVVLGAKAAFAVPTRYSTTIFMDVVSK